MAKRALDFSGGTSVDVKPKRQTQKEVLSPNKVKSLNAHATIHALVMSMSPPKKKGTFFDGELTDGDRVIRIVGFEKKTTKKNWKNSAKKGFPSV